ncbi:MAG: class IV adenylate cyclase [Ignavibacteriaceae bacterium]
MPRNLELKVPCNSFNKIIKILEGVKADYIGELVQKDVYYQINSGLLKLRIENGEQSLIKYSRDETGKDRWSDFHVIKFWHGDAEDFLKDIFSIETIVEKNRLVYIYDNTRIHLDKVKGLGEFLELETLVVNGLEDAKKRFNDTITILELDLNSQIKNSYKILIEEKKK